MGFNNEIQPFRQNVTEFVNRLRVSEYFVDRSFQRRLVWTARQKVRLLETVLIDYPMPEVYLWEQSPDIETGLQKSSIVDGQQRLTTLRQFLGNEWPLTKSYLNTENQDADYTGKYWKDLSADRKSQILQYNINARRIPSIVPKEQIRLIFARLNETDKSLNPQELRNATFHGEFLLASEEIADCEEMKKLDLFTVNDARRMKDIEFASQLLGFERRGIVDDDTESMNSLYDNFSDIYENRSEDIRRVQKSLSRIDILLADSTARALFTSQNNIYTLHGFLSLEGERSNEVLTEGLSSFATAYRQLPTETGEGNLDRNLLNFRTGASSRTRSKSSRAQRQFGLLNWFKQHVDEGSKP